MTEEFSIDFGNAKEFTRQDLPEEGTYTLKIVDYSLLAPKKEESKGKGMTAALKFSIEELGEDSKFRVQTWIWLDKENPWGAKPFYEAVTGQDLEDDGLDVTDVDAFIGEKVGCFLVHEMYEQNGKSKWKLSPQGNEAWFSV